MVACAAMANILNDARQQQVIALGQLGWTRRRIEAATGVRRATAGCSLRAIREGKNTPALIAEILTEAKRK
jgi:hypothetical protein